VKAISGEIIDPPRKKKQHRELLPIPDTASRIDMKRAKTATEAMEILDPKRETFEERQERLENKRIPYAGMVAHKEMAAMVLAAGGGYRLAAAKAGVSVRQVKKYYTTADFRARIDELRKSTFSKILGRVLKELEVRTDPKKIGQIELLDLLRVWDRVAGAPGKGGAGGMNIGEINVTNNNYDALVAALVAAKRGGEGSDFQEYRPEDLLLPGESPPE
jgi:hypothetical protein